MPKRGRISRQVVIDETISLFDQRGYHNTTMDDIADRCNIKKSSLYHHIASRKALAKLVVESLMHGFKQRCDKVVYDTRLSNTDRLKKLGTVVSKFFTERKGGRLLSSLAIELGHSFEDINALFQTHFNDWINAIAHLLEDNCENKEEARMIAEDTVSQIQGAYVLAQSYDQKKVLFKRAIDRLINHASV